LRRACAQDHFVVEQATRPTQLLLSPHPARQNLREPGELGRVAANARTGSLVGFTSWLGSASWFTAFTLQIAAYVRTLGLVELAFTLLISRYAFREHPRRTELLGLGLLGVGILMVLNSGR